MNKKEFKKFFATTLVSYGQQPDTARIKITSEAVEDAVGINFNWGKVFSELMATEQYCPTAFTIIDKLRRESGEINPKFAPDLKATKFVDQMIQCFHGPEQEWAGLGRTNYYICKDVLGVTRRDFQCGLVNPQFMRKQWIEKIKSYFEKLEFVDREQISHVEKAQIEGDV